MGDIGVTIFINFTPDDTLVLCIMNTMQADDDDHDGDN